MVKAGENYDSGVGGLELMQVTKPFHHDSSLDRFVSAPWSPPEVRMIASRPNQLNNTNVLTYDNTPRILGTVSSIAVQPVKPYSGEFKHVIVVLVVDSSAR